jgi:hypothetical protein
MYQYAFICSVYNKNQVYLIFIRVGGHNRQKNVTTKFLAVYKYTTAKGIGGFNANTHKSPWQPPYTQKWV